MKRVAEKYKWDFPRCPYFSARYRYYEVLFLSDTEERYMLTQKNYYKILSDHLKSIGGIHSRTETNDC